MLLGIPGIFPRLTATTSMTGESSNRHYLPDSWALSPTFAHGIRPHITCQGATRPPLSPPIGSLKEPTIGSSRAPALYPHSILGHYLTARNRKTVAPWGPGGEDSEGCRQSSQSHSWVMTVIICKIQKLMIKDFTDNRL